jgi:hypothetical protein
LIRKELSSLAVLLAVVGLLGGCAAAPSVPDNGHLTKRVAARWDLLIAGKLDEAYDYLSPGKRSLITPEQYRSSIKTGLWRDSKVDSIECGEVDLCKVKVLVSYSYKGKSADALDITRPLIETWRRQAGEWWFVQTE